MGTSEIAKIGTQKRAERLRNLQELRLKQHEELTECGMLARVLRQAIGMTEVPEFVVVRKQPLAQLTDEALAAQPHLLDLYNVFQYSIGPLANLVELQLLEPTEDLEQYSPDRNLVCIGISDAHVANKYLPVSGVSVGDLSYVDAMASMLRSAADVHDIEIDTARLVAAPPTRYVKPERNIPLV
ncbi:MAG TPA: hypothetical protein VFN56_05095 [Candidatus Saccharimonadales bacterium]|nr:hypothetical protein [Candidatus Saccharimonadales bacterium]